MQRFCQWVTTIILLLLPGIGATQDIDLVKIGPLIVGATEDLRKALLRTDLTASEYKDVLQTTCYTLTELSQNKGIERALREYEARQYDDALSPEIRKIFLDFRSFLEFLFVEERILREAGLSEETVADFLGLVLAARPKTAGFRIEAQTLLNDLERMADQACVARENVTELVQYSTMMCNLKRYGVFGVGATFVIVDAIGALIPAGIPQAAAVASVSAGSLLMGLSSMMPQC